MKLISSLVRPERVDGIRAELGSINVVALTVSQVRDHAPQNHGTLVWRSQEYSLGFSCKMELRVVVDDDDVDRVIQVIMRAARTGRSGDGHISVSPVDHRYDISTGRREAS